MAAKKEETKQPDDDEVEDTGLSTADTYVQIFLIQIEVAKATNLTKADVFGLSDPYCRVTAFRQTYTTRTIMKTLDPVWNEKTQFIFFKDPKELTFNVWDWDKGTKHDPIGDYTLSLAGFFDANHAGFSGPLQLKNVKKGELYVTVKGRKLLPIELEVKATEFQNLEKQQNQTMTEQDEKIKSLNNDNTALTQANRNLEEQILGLRNKKTQMENEVSLLNQQKQKLEDQKTTLLHVQDSLRKEYEGLNAQCTVLQSTLDEEQAVIGDLAGEMEGLKQEHRKLAKELEDADGEIGKLQNEINKEKLEKNKTKNKPLLNVTAVDDNSKKAASPSAPSQNETKPTAPLIQEPAEPARGGCQCCLIQ